MQLAGKRVAGGDGGAEKRDRAKGRAPRGERGKSGGVTEGEGKCTHKVDI